MKSISSLSLRYLKQNIQRTFMTIVGVTISALLIYSILSSSISVFENSNKTTYERNMGWDAAYVLNGEDACKVLSHVEYYNEHPESIGNVTADGNLSLPEMSYGWMMTADASNQFLAINDVNAMPFGMSVVKGTIPNSSNGLAVSKTVATINKLKVGSTNKVTSGVYDEDGKFVRGQEYEYKITGIFDDSKYEMEYYDSEFFGVIFNGYIDGFTKMSPEMYKNENVTIYVSFEDKHDITAQAEQIAQLFSLDRKEYLINSVSIEYFHKENSNEPTSYLMFRVIILALGAIVGLIAIFLVRNAFNISVHERSNDYGILRCIGLTRKQIIRIILGESFVIAIIGTILGIVVGHGLCYLIFSIIGKNYEYLGGYHISADALLWTFIIMLIVTMYSMISPIQLLYKLNPIEALRRIDEIENLENKKKSKHKKESAKKAQRRLKKQIKKTDKITKKYGVEAGYAYRNITRAKRRFVLTIVTITFGASTFVGSGTFLKGMENEILDVAGLGVHSGLFICFDTAEANAVKKDLSSLDCVEGISENVQGMFYTYKENSESIIGGPMYVGVAEEDYNKILAVSNVGDKDKSSKAFNMIKVTDDVNDMDNIELGNFNLPGRYIHPYAQVEVNSAGPILASINEQIVYAMDREAVFIYNINDGYTADISNSAGSMDYNINVDINAKAHDAYKFDNYVENTLHYYIDYAKEKKLVVDTMKIVKFVIQYVVVLILVIFFINSINITCSQMYVRKDEFNTLSVIGMSRKQKKKMLMIESMASTIISIPLSIVLGYLSGNLLNRAFYIVDFIEEEEVVWPKFVFDGKSSIVMFVLLIAIGYISAKIGNKDALAVED